jgi:hypothetical protein
MSPNKMDQNGQVNSMNGLVGMKNDQSNPNLKTNNSLFSTKVGKHPPRKQNFFTNKLNVNIQGDV